MAKTQGRIPAISQTLFEEFQRVMPLHADKRGARKPSDKDIQVASEASLKKFYEAAKTERLRHRLGIVGRARVAFGLQQRLIEAGYPSLLVKQVLFAMLTSAFIGDKQ